MCHNDKSQFMHRSEFESFVVSVRPLLIARASSVVGDTDTAADIVQDCLLKLWSMRMSLDDYDSPEALAVTIVHRLALNTLRSKKTVLEIRDDIMPDSQASPEQMAIDAESADQVHALLAMLPDAQQSLITMRHVEGLSNAEIAQIVGSTEGAVRTALSRARNHIAEIFLKYQLSNK